VNDLRIPRAAEAGTTPIPPARRWHRVALAVAVPVAFIFFAVSILSVEGSRRTGIGIADYSAPAVAEDRLAPSFTLPRLGGRGVITLDDLAGHPVVLSFWASWCPPCRREAPFLRTAWNTYRADGVAFLGVDHRDARSAGLSFARRLAIPYPSVFDAGGELARRYGLFGIPTTLVIRPDGRIAYRISGRVDATNLGSALRRVVGNGEEG
jgi:cytochrome c biogenesis protein CcmG/thiol:disulfide interchange protein DsbE